jgi:hypothetical protein
MNQADLFPDLPPAANPSGNFGEVRVAEQNKIIRYPLSFWKDGRMRADLSAFGAGEVVSRNKQNFEREVARRLQEKLCAAVVEIVSDVSEEFARPRPTRPARPRKKALKAIAPVAYISPFPKKETDPENWHFARCPNWLLERPNCQVCPSEKLIYGRLSFPLTAFCKRYFELSGAAMIEKLDQDALAKKVGMSRPTINSRLVKLQELGLIHCVGNQGGKLDLLFPWHEWMPPQTCKHCLQLRDGKLVATTDKSCKQSGQEPVVIADKSCKQLAQASQGIEKKDCRREEKRKSHSFGWGS